MHREEAFLYKANRGRAVRLILKFVPLNKSFRKYFVLDLSEALVMKTALTKSRRFGSLLLETVIFVSILSWSIPGYGAGCVQEQGPGVVQMQMGSPISLNILNEQPFGRITPDKTAILRNSYQHNVFYVEITTNAP